MELHERLAPASGPAGPLPPPDSFAEVKDRIHLEIIEELGRQIFGTQIDPVALRARVSAEVRSRLDQEPGLSREDRGRLADDLTADILGHGPLGASLPTERRDGSLPWLHRGQLRQVRARP